MAPSWTFPGGERKEGGAAALATWKWRGKEVEKGREIGEREGMERDGKGGKGQGEGFAWLLQLEMTREDSV